MIIKLVQILQLKDTHGKQLKSKGHGEVLRASKGTIRQFMKKKYING